MPGVLTETKRLERQKEFINNALKIYGSRYDYSKVKFINKKTNVVLICKVCSPNKEFSLSPHSHLNGVGCKECKEPRNPIIYKGKNFRSKKSLAEHLGISRRTLSNRIKDGWEEEEWGIRLRQFNEGIEYKGIKFSSVKNLANHLDIPHRTLLGRISRNLSEDLWSLSSEEVTKLSRRKHFEVSEQIEKETRFRMLGLYTVNSNPTRFLCLKHYQVHLAEPANILNGQGLYCCGREARDNRIKELTFTNEEYDKKIAEFGVVKRLGNYINNHTSINHYCLIHKKTYPALPASILKGRGLKCCALASINAQADLRKSKAKNELTDVLKNKNPTIIWVGGEYEGDKVKLDFLCLKHNEIHPSTPGRVKSGTGLKCCHRAASVASGKKMGPLNGGDNDNVWRALTRTLKRSNKELTDLYLFESPLSTHNKYGISSDLSRRIKDGGYGEQLMAPHFFTNRKDAVLIEQAFKFGWGVEPPSELENWIGKTELTTLPPLEFEDVITDLEEALFVMGEWKFAEEYCDPIEVRKARRFLGLKADQYP